MCRPLQEDYSEQFDSGFYSENCSTTLPYELSRPVEQSAGLYCMIITFKGSTPGAPTCYNRLTTWLAATGGDSSYIAIGVRECPAHA